MTIITHDSLLQNKLSFCITWCDINMCITLKINNYHVIWCLCVVGIDVYDSYLLKNDGLFFIIFSIGIGIVYINNAFISAYKNYSSFTMLTTIYENSQDIAIFITKGQVLELLISNLVILWLWNCYWLFVIIFSILICI